MGIVIMNGRAVYGHNHGLMLPEWLLRLAVRLWNHAACRVLGHDDVLWHLAEHDPSFPYAPECTHCLAPLRGCTGTGMHQRHSKCESEE